MDDCLARDHAAGICRRQIQEALLERSQMQRGKPHAAIDRRDLLGNFSMRDGVDLTRAEAAFCRSLA